MSETDMVLAMERINAEQLQLLKLSKIVVNYRLHALVRLECTC